MQTTEINKIIWNEREKGITYTLSKTKIHSETRTTFRNTKSDNIYIYFILLSLRRTRKIDHFKSPSHFANASKKIFEKDRQKRTQIDIISSTSEPTHTPEQFTQHENILRTKKRDQSITRLSGRRENSPKQPSHTLRGKLLIM